MQSDHTINTTSILNPTSLVKAILAVTNWVPGVLWAGDRNGGDKHGLAFLPKDTTDYERTHAYSAQPIAVSILRGDSRPQPLPPPPSTPHSP